MEPLKGKTIDMSGSKSVSTKQQRIAELAKNAPDMAMDLSHHLDQEWFVEAFKRTRKDGAVGVDGISGSEYGLTLDEHIERLRSNAGTYQKVMAKKIGRSGCRHSRTNCCSARSRCY
jgi:RNA-directed DNA polymerase